MLAAPPKVPQLSKKRKALRYKERQMQKKGTEKICTKREQSIKTKRRLYIIKRDKSKKREPKKYVIIREENKKTKQCKAKKK